MKAIIFTITIFLSSIFFAPVLQAETLANNLNTELFGGGPKVNKSSAKRFKTYKGQRRGKHTCLKKNGCKPKLRKAKKTKCGGFM